MSINTSSNQYLNQCKIFHSKFLNDARYVFKSLNGQYMAVMTLHDHTKHNETRYTVKNMEQAKHRASGVNVVLIFDKFDPVRSVESVTTTFAGIPTTYTVDQTTLADSYDTNIANADSGGIFYYRTMDCAFYYNLEMLNYTGEYYDWHYNGLLKEKGMLTNGRKSGYWEDFYGNGQLCTKSVYSNDKLNGEYYEFFENGNKSEIGYFVNDVPVGFSVGWHENGEKASEGNYDDDGLEHGYWLNWREDGRRELFCTYDHGSFDGLYVKYSSEGFNVVEVAGLYRLGLLEEYDLSTVKLIF